MYEVRVLQQREELLYVVNDCILVVFSRYGKLREPNLLSVPLAVLLQFLKGSFQFQVLVDYRKCKKVFLEFFQNSESLE